MSLDKLIDTIVGKNAEFKTYTIIYDYSELQELKEDIDLLIKAQLDKQLDNLFDYFDSNNLDIHADDIDWNGNTRRDTEEVLEDFKKEYYATHK